MMPEVRIPAFEKLESIDFRTNINAPAELFFENIREAIKAYEDQLEDSKQLIWSVACLNGKEYQVTEVGYVNPSLIRFCAFDEACIPCQLLVNVSSVQFIVRAVDREKGQQQRRIGFQSQ